MKRNLLLLIALFPSFVFAQDFDLDDDSFFEDDTIVEMESVEKETVDSSSEKYGLLFKDGSVKVGGSFDTSLSIFTPIITEDSKNVKENLKDTKLTPTVSALLSVDARPTQVLRMYTKFGLQYPFVSSATSIATQLSSGYTQVKTTISDYLKVKELFTDFSISDRAFFRFGLHTVSWGTGYFFSPVSDIINTSSIDPENTSEQVDGSINLRTQITFTNTQNCLWLYIIPSTDFVNAYSADSYLKNTALASKMDLVFGDWELGLGGFYQYKHAPKLTLTATGTLLGKISLFGEYVYQYGAMSQWEKDSSWSNKKSIMQATAGLSYYWKTPQITFVAQYYYDGNDKDLEHQYFTQGHNLAAMVNFGRIFGTTDFTASFLALANFGKESFPDLLKQTYVSLGGNPLYLSYATFSATLNYNPIKALTISMGPYITIPDWDSSPNAALKLTFTLGGGKF